jgi:hypothetical protein
VKRTLSLPIFLALISVTAISYAGPGHKEKAKVACPVCKMDIVAKKDKAHPVAVRLKKGAKTMYCCDKCKMPDSVLVKPAKSKKK